MTEIYYFTGTGNSLFAAKHLAEQLDSVQLIPIASLIKQDEIKISENKIGLSFPVYIGGMPLIVKEFVKKLKFEAKPYIFAIATNAGTVASTLVMVDTLLKQKEQRLSAGFSLCMISNYVPMYDAEKDEIIKERLVNARQEIKRIAEIIKAGKKTKIETSNPIANFVFSKIVYPLMSHKIPNMDKDFWADEKCNSCGLCEQICPVDNIKLEDGKPIWMHHCQQCMACIQWCPQEAIQHKNKTSKRNRYHNPEVSLQEILDQKKRMD